MNEPSFKDGNRAFANALNEVVAFAKFRGVNPAGRPGWSESPDGYVPPYTGAGGVDGGLARWDLEPQETEDDEAPVEYLVFRPSVKLVQDDVESGFADVTQGVFIPISNRWLVAEMTLVNFVPEFEIKILQTWDGFPSPFKFGAPPAYPFEFARFPIWRFYSEDDEGRIQFNDDIYGEKLVRGDILQLIPGLVKVPDVNVWRSVNHLV